MIAVACILVLAGLSGCGSESTDSPIRTKHVSKATYTGTWPATVDGGTLACDGSKGDAVTFSPDGSTDIYAMNGPAIDREASEGWKDFDDIWLKTPDGFPGPRVYDSLLDGGLEICEDHTGTPETASTTEAPETASTTEASAQPLPSALDTPLRGFMSKPQYWDQAFGAAIAEECAAAGYDGMTPVRAWRLTGGALACAGNPDIGAWDGRVVNLSVYFDPPVDERAALRELAAIYPADNQVTDIHIGHNSAITPPKYPDGSCEDSQFTSDALGAATSGVLASWTGNPRKSDVTLYSGNVTAADGSDAPFQSDTVRQALIGLGSNSPRDGC